MDWKTSRVQRLFAAGLSLALLLFVSACQENPEGSIVVHEDTNSLVSQAQEEAPSKVEADDIIDDVTEDSDAYQVHLEDESLRVTVDVDAQVDVPEVDKLSVYRVRQAAFDQAFVDLIREKLMGDQAVYDGSVLSGRTRQFYLDSIESFKRELARFATDNGLDLGEDFENVSPDAQKTLDELQKELENTPDRIDVTEYPHDGMLRTVEELYAANPGNLDYLNLHRDDPGGTYLKIVTDGADGNGRVLRVQNSERYGAHLVFHSMPNAYTEAEILYRIWLNNLSFGQKGGLLSNTLKEVSPADGEALTQEDAVRQAEEFLEEIGVTGFAFAEGGLYDELIPVRIAETNTYSEEERRCYILQFRRRQDGVWVSQPGDAAVYEGEDNAQKLWLEEGIEFRIDESGIVGFYMAAPLEITETVAEHAALKSFEEVKSIFESGVCAANAGRGRQCSIDIDKVRLCYSCVREQDSPDTGLIVPIWSFEGRTEIKQSDYTQLSTKAPLMINAIDGSIIEEEFED